MEIDFDLKKSTMKKILFLCFCCIFSFGNAQDQQLQKENLEEKVRQRIDYLDKELQFNENQKKQLHSFFLQQMQENEATNEKRREAREEIQKNRAQNQNTRQKVKNQRIETRAIIGERREQTKQRMSEILSPEQFQKWQEIKENSAQVWKERRLKRLEERKKKRSKESDPNINK
jgi:Spy/CpxP family protein refolding chaperone